MDKKTDEMYERITNQDLMTIATNCLEEISNRSSLQDYLTEMTYNDESDEYELIYDADTFKDFISDFKKYLKSNIYRIQSNKKETR